MPSYGYRETQQTPKIFRLLKSKKLALLLGVVGVAVLLITFSNKGLLRRILLEQDLSARKERIEQLQADIKTLRETRDRLLTDKSAIEHVARETHGMIKPGEIVYHVKPATSTPTR